MREKLWVIFWVWMMGWYERIRAYVANEEPYPVIDLRYLRFLEAEQRKVDALNLQNCRILDNGVSACLGKEDRENIRFLGLGNCSGLLAYVDNKITTIPVVEQKDTTVSDIKNCKKHEGSNSLKATDIVKVFSWLEAQEPGVDSSMLESVAERCFGTIKWRTQMGYGEGSLTCTFIERGVSGYSSGADCNGQEALIDALIKLIA